MKYFYSIIVLLFFSSTIKAQHVDSIYFHLYTDSLKKGQHNYINVDGKLSDGRWMPLTAKEITFSSSCGTFEGNELIIPADFIHEKVTVTATLKSNPALKKEITIYIKKNEDPELTPVEEYLKKPRRKIKQSN